jgi:hypothetical protein
MFENLETNPTATGTIDALNEMIELDCPGSSSAVVSVTGTFDGVLTVTGSGETVQQDGTQGGRLVFKSGVGSIGENKIRNEGDSIDTEYRIVTGGKSVRVKATEWSSGSCVVRITASPNPSIIFINGPCMMLLRKLYGQEELTRWEQVRKS